MNEPTITNEILNGNGLNLAAAARLFPPYRGTKPINPSTVFRWIMSGVRLSDGSLLRLEARRIGGRWLTYREAVERFIDKQTPRFSDDPVPQSRMLRRHTKAAERAGRELDKIGSNREIREHAKPGQ